MKSIDQVLSASEHQYRSQNQRQFQSLLQCWHEVVGAAVAVQTRPISLHRGTLKVATSSAVWANTLTLQRMKVLEKLNARFSPPFVDIKFSTAEWHSPSRSVQAPGPEQQRALWRDHPSQLREPIALPRIEPAQAICDPNAAFRYWAKVMQTRSRHLTLCPQCKCPTPAGELERWAVCALCAVKKW